MGNFKVRMGTTIVHINTIYIYITYINRTDRLYTLRLYRQAGAAVYVENVMFSDYV